ncbi:hypothetical protein F4680DRAFT_449844 [Xylaria scruposa]|nr:hypothetical protein F4680DRAFT_449844 [Xylaria scruposa]
MSHSGRCKYKRFQRFLRLLLATVAIVAVVSDSSSGNGNFWLVDWSFQFFTINGFIIFWDLVSLSLGHRQFAILSLELIIFTEISMLAAFIYGIVEYTEPYIINEQPPPGDIFILLLWVLATIITLILLYQYIRSYPNYWRLRRDSRGTKPLIAFSETGDPIAILPSTFRYSEIAVERLSIDSLQQSHEGEWEVAS